MVKAQVSLIPYEGLPTYPDEDTSVQKYFRSSVLDEKPRIALDQEQDNVETNDLKTNTRIHHYASLQESSRVSLEMMDPSCTDLGC